MASQLREVLNRFTEQTRPLSTGQIARELEIEPGLLEDMIAYWVRKGKLRAVTGAGQDCGTCGIQGACPFIVNLPRYYEPVSEEPAAESSPAPPCSCCH
jgi:hypothetical protein